jgi:hypothetical protein
MIAEILEEVVRNTPPSNLVKRKLDKMLKADLDFNIYADDEIVRLEYYFPVDTIMKYVDGTDKEVLDWLRTGDDAQFQEHEGRRCIVIRKSFTDRAVTIPTRKVVWDAMMKIIVSQPPDKRAKSVSKK